VVSTNGTMPTARAQVGAHPWRPMACPFTTNVVIDCRFSLFTSLTPPPPPRRHRRLRTASYVSFDALLILLLLFRKQFHAHHFSCNHARSQKAEGVNGVEEHDACCENKNDQVNKVVAAVAVM
jgi:hypothetical protein